MHFIVLSFISTAALGGRSCLPSSVTEGSEGQRRQVIFSRTHSKEALMQGFKPRPIFMVPLSQDKLKNQILKTRLPGKHSGLAGSSFRDILWQFQRSAGHNLSDS